MKEVDVARAVYETALKALEVTSKENLGEYLKVLAECNSAIKRYNKALILMVSHQ